MTELIDIPIGRPVLTAPRIVGPVPASGKSTPYSSCMVPGSHGDALMRHYDYVEEEYFLFGHANVYGPGLRSAAAGEHGLTTLQMKPLAGIVQPAMPYATRILLVRPRDNTKFSGRVHAYMFHNLNAKVAVERNLLRQGDAVLGLEGCSGTRFGPLEVPSGGIAQLHKFDLQRYRDLRLTESSPLAWPDLTPGRLGGIFENLDFGSPGGGTEIFQQEIYRSYGQAPDIFTQLAHALKNHDPAFPFEDKVGRVFSYALSGGTTFLQPYIDNHHAAGLLPDGRPPCDGYLVSVGLLPQTRPKRAVLVYLESEAEVIGAIKSGRVDPPDTDDPLFRIYQIPGAGHLISAPLPEEAGGLTEVEEIAKVVPEGIRGLSDVGEPPVGVIHYNKINAPIVWGIWHNMYNWIERGIPMPHADPIKRNATARDGVARDEHENALGGLRTPWVDVPDGTYLARISPKDPLRAGLRPFDEAKMKALYGDRDTYRAKLGEALQRLVDERWILQEDSSVMQGQT